MIIMSAGGNYFKLRFDESELKSGECGHLLRNIKTCIPSGPGGRFYFPEKKEWRIHFRHWGQFIFIVSQYKIGAEFLFNKVFKAKQKEFF